MAFFGLTALGVQNPFADATSTSTKSAPLLHVFTDNDFQSAWKKIAGPSVDTIPTTSLRSVFELIFRGPVPEKDSNLLDNAFQNEADEIDNATYMQTLIDLRNYLEREEATFRQSNKSGCEVTSAELLKERNRRHIRLEKAPNQKQAYPLTSSQEIGWLPQGELEPPVAGRKDSAVTKFAAELVKNGVYY
mmetsp:Transcript_18613/g.18707  ORF Transcript_18613/g.18707 Transcript_18613/m.18707 type:complete len:190 (-) Transcript_18613:103-672(-)|eukprot:CAMPEP_0182426824 /NCGR_PEP_ID=MMETSP1167-20130531/13344_1 /TAXON_ID=2988 /ORGANISM="Mallomonas Sp, Strain CCMP3275" /LENGTH=189 /DNA_ID=CAMNT_0024608537 /DNA_START=52 /DNA_END=621 /DNA_ORIENTATION=-